MEPDGKKPDQVYRHEFLLALARDIIAAGAVRRAPELDDETHYGVRIDLDALEAYQRSRASESR